MQCYIQEVFQVWISILNKNIGARCVGYNNKKSVGPYEFKNYGGHCDNYPHAYFTAASAIGIEKQDVDAFIDRLDKNWKQYLKDIGKKKSTSSLFVCW